MFHPIRWTLLCALGAPLLLLLLLGIAHAAGNAGLSRAVFRGLRWITAAELALLLLLATTGAVYEYRSRIKARRDFPPPGKLVDLGGYSLHIQCTGPTVDPTSQSVRPTIVLDSGLVGSVLDWRRVLLLLGQFAHVCAYDRGGYGWSDTSPRPRTLDGITADLHALLERSGATPPYVLVGHSLGGLNMWAYANRYPAEVAGLVLLDAADPQQSFPFRWQERLRILVLRWSLPFGLPRWRGWCGSGPEEIRPVRTAVTCQPRYQLSYYRQCTAMPEYLTEARRLSSLGSLPLIVVSRDTTSADPRQERANAEHNSQWHAWQQSLRGISTNSRFAMAEGSGHDIPGERPDVVVQAIRDLLDQLQH